MHGQPPLNGIHPILPFPTLSCMQTQAAVCLACHALALPSPLSAVRPGGNSAVTGPTSLMDRWRSAANRVTCSAQRSQRCHA